MKYHEHSKSLLENADEEEAQSRVRVTMFEDDQMKMDNLVNETETAADGDGLGTSTTDLEEPLLNDARKDDAPKIRPGLSDQNYFESGRQSCGICLCFIELHVCRSYSLTYMYIIPL